MLVLTIAAGVFLGWLGIQAVQGIATKWRCTVPEAIWTIFCRTVFYSIAILCVSIPIVATIEYHAEIRQYAKEHKGVMAVCFAVLLFGSISFGFYLDWRARRAVRHIAIELFCTECGKQGLDFRRFQDGLNSGHKYPVVSCSKCGHEQGLGSFLQ